MSRVLGLAVKITGDSSQVKLTPLERALQSLDFEAAKVAKVFAQFGDSSELAAAASEKFRGQADQLKTSLTGGTIGAAEYARQFGEITKAANEEAIAIDRARETTSRYRSEIERFDDAQRQLKVDLDAGRVSQETYNRAVEDASKGLADADRSSRGLAVATKDAGDAAEYARQFAETTKAANEEAVAIDRAAATTAKYLTEIERFDDAHRQLKVDLDAGRISQETYNRAVADASKGLTAADRSSRGLAAATKDAGDKLPGLASLFRTLPGPIGAIASQLAGLVNPTTAAITAVALLARGLSQLEDRVSRLGDLADQLGVSFEFIQTLEEAGRRTGVSFEGIASAMTRLQTTLAGTDDESKKAIAALGQLGLTIQDIDGLSEQGKIELIGRQIAGIEDPSKRTAAAIGLFGKAGAGLLPFFRNLAPAAADIEKFGLVISGLDRERIDKFGRSMDAAAVASQGLGQSLLIPFAGLGEKIGLAMANVVSSITSIVEPLLFILQPVLTLIGSLVETGGMFTLMFASLGGILKMFVDLVKLPDDVNEAATGRQKLFDGVQASLKSAAAASAEFGRDGLAAAAKYQASIGALHEQLDRGLIGQAEFGAEAEKARAVFDEQIKIVEAGAKLAIEITGRVDGLLESAKKIPQIEKEIGDVEVEIARVAAAITAARAAGDTEALAQLTTRLGQLDQLHAGQVQQQDEAEQGFTEGFTKAFDSVGKGIESLVEKAADFGLAGQAAAEQLAAGIADAQDQVKDGILTQATFDKEVERQKKLFENRVDGLRKAQKVADKLAEQSAAMAEKAAEKAAELAAAQIDVVRESRELLSSPRSGSVQVGDIRSGGIAAFFATLKEDPAVSEAKKQTSELVKMRRELAKLNAERVEILGGVG